MSGNQGTGGGVTVALQLIAVLDRDFAIGRHNMLPWHLPDDLKRFKALTLGKPLLMGRRTAQSLGRALPRRRNLVLSHGAAAPFAGMQMVISLEQACALAAADGAETLCVIGGAQVYALCLPLAVRMDLTWVDTRVEGADAFFPRFDLSQWRVLHRHPHAADARHRFAFESVEYMRS